MKWADVPFVLLVRPFSEYRRLREVFRRTLHPHSSLMETMQMITRLARVFALFFAASATAGAQHGGSAPAVKPAPPEARQFAFLVGQHELVVKPAATTLATRIHGVPKMIGTWKGWRAMDGYGIEDELRITDESGNPRTLSHAMRYYDASARKWMGSAVDVYRGVFTTSAGEWRDNALTMTSRGVDGDGKPYVSRATYFDITPMSFRYRQDRSTDDGKTWKEGVLSIEAKRVAAAAPR